MKSSKRVWYLSNFWYCSLGLPMVKPEMGDKGGSSTDEEVKIELCAYKGNSVSEKKVTSRIY